MEAQIGIYQILNQIGSGATASVFLGENVLNKEKVCVKVLQKSSLVMAEDFEFFRREVDILSSLRHINIVRYIDLLEDEAFYYLIQEYCPGINLTAYIEKYGPLSDSAINTIFNQIFMALQYLHSKGVGHRDMKPDNIIISPNDVVKIVDFGLSTDDNSKLRTTFCGSLAFAAPECIRREPYNASKADIWSIGVILFLASVGKMPWKTSNLVVLMRQITSGSFTVPCSVSPNVRQLILSCLHQDPSKRPKAEELLEMPICRAETAKVRRASLHSPRPHFSMKRTVSNPVIKVHPPQAVQPPSTPRNGRCKQRRGSTQQISPSIDDLIGNTPPMRDFCSSILAF